MRLNVLALDSRFCLLCTWVGQKSNLQFADELLKAEPPHKLGWGWNMPEMRIPCAEIKGPKKTITSAKSILTQNIVWQKEDTSTHFWKYRKVYLKPIVACLPLEQNVFWYGSVLICRDKSGSCLKFIREGHVFFLRLCVKHIENTLLLYLLCVYTELWYSLRGKFFR